MIITKKYEPKTKEQLQQEMNELIEQSTEQIKKYQASPEALIELADFMSTIHKYSLRNLALIVSQFQGAMAVASFKDWKEKGFSVQKGEKGIKIFVHTPIKKFLNNQGEWKNVSTATEEEKAKIKSKQYETRTVSAFKKGTVFDVSQTNATPEDLPEIFPNKVWHFDLGGENSLSEIREGITTLSQSLSIEIKDMQEVGYELGNIRGAYAQYTNNKDEILLNSRNTNTQNVSVSIHELAHKYLHQKVHLDKLTEKQKSLGMTDTSVKEFQAELVSYIVCKNYGMDTSVETIPYLASWTDNLQKIDSKIMTDVLDSIRQTSQKFINTMDQAILAKREHALLKDKSHSISDKLAEIKSNLQPRIALEQAQKTGVDHIGRSR